MLKPILDFAARVGAKISLNPDLVVPKDGRYFLLNRELVSLISDDFFFAGAYLGKAKKYKFFPSFILLQMLAEDEGNKVVVERKAAWLFICGRDIFAKGIREVQGSRRKGDYALVVNEYEECLGFGRISANLNAEMKKNEVAVKNISDVGDFLRRER